MGIAGEPPPEPMSIHGVHVSSIVRAADSGSIRSRSNVSSVGSASGKAVRFTFAFQRASSRRYASSRSATLTSTDTPALLVRLARRSRNAFDVMPKLYDWFASKNGLNRRRAQQQPPESHLELEARGQGCPDGPASTAEQPRARALAHGRTENRVEFGAARPCELARYRSPDAAGSRRT